MVPHEGKAQAVNLVTHKGQKDTQSAAGFFMQTGNHSHGLEENSIREHKNKRKSENVRLVKTTNFYLDP